MAIRFHSKQRATSVAAGAGTGDGVVLRGPSTVLFGVAAPVGTGTVTPVNRFIATPIGKDVYIVARTDTDSAENPAASFTGGAKHLKGDSIYGVDSDSTAVFIDADTLTVSGVLAVDHIPAPVPAADDFTGVDTWVAK